MRKKTTWLVGSGLKAWLVTVYLSGVLAPPAIKADHGIYESLPIEHRELQLLETASDFEALGELHGGIYRHPELDELLYRIGSRLAPPSTDPYLEYRFHVLLNPHPFAFALPDGQVYVTVGMLAVLENEAQLATLLAHEINHAADHHGIRRYRNARRASAVFAPFWVALGIALEADWEVGDVDPPRVSLEEHLTKPAIRGYSQELEEETDDRAIRRVAEIGYDVRQSARLYEILGRDPEGEGKTKWNAQPRQLLKRAAELRRTASDLGKKTDLDGLDVGAESYRDLRWQVSLDTVYKYIAMEDSQSAMSIAEALVEERKDDPEAHFALAEARDAAGVHRELLSSAVMPAWQRTKGPRLPPPDPMNGSIALTVQAPNPGNLRFRSPVVKIFFVKLDEGTEAFGAADLIPSSYANEKQVYLLNAEPGRYVAVAANLPRFETKKTLFGKSGPYLTQSYDWSVFFSMAMIAATEVSVVAQEMVFMGEYSVTSTKMKKADQAQAHYYRLRQHDVAGSPASARGFGRHQQHAFAADLKGVARDPATERGFWTRARDEVFKHDRRWQIRAARQLAAVSEQDPN